MPAWVSWHSATLIVPLFLAALCHISWKTTAVFIQIAVSWWLDDRLICRNFKCDCPGGISMEHRTIASGWHKSLERLPCFWLDWKVTHRCSVHWISYSMHHISQVLWNNFPMHHCQKVIPQHKQFPCTALQAEGRRQYFELQLKKSLSVCLESRAINSAGLSVLSMKPCKPQTTRYLSKQFT